MLVATREDRVRHDAPQFGPAEPARSLSSRFTGSVQFVGSFVGIPLALANLKLIPVSLMPLGKQIVPVSSPTHYAPPAAA